MSEPTDKLDVNSLNEALELSGETDDPTKSKGSEEQAREIMNKSNTLAAAATTEDGKASPATLSPGSPAGSPVPAAAASASVAAAAAPNATQAPAPPNVTAATPPMDPTVQQIKSMFPEMDNDTIQAVVVSEGGDFERAINTLLQMSDPTYVPPPPLQQPNQTDQDEQLARSLAAADENEARSQQRFTAPSGRGGALGSLFGGGGGGGGGPEQASYDPSKVTYQPRVRRTPSSQANTPPAMPQRQSSYTQQQQQHASSGQSGGGVGAVAWPGPKEAKQWQEDINKLAETGFAKAASTFSALRQRSEQAWAGRNQEGASGGSSGEGAGAGASSFLGSWNPRNNSAQAGQSTVSPTIGSGRGFDRDPSPVGDNELAKILARGRSSGRSGSGADSGAYNLDGAADGGQQRKSSLGNITDRYKKVAQTQRGGKARQSSRDDTADEGDADGGLSWDDAGRTDATAPAKSFEPIRINDHSRSNSIDGSKTSPAPQQRNAVSLMESSTGRGLTSPSALATSHGGATETGKEVQKDADDDDDDDDLEYVANPFEDDD